jgi:hypothetical protein
MLSPLHVSEGAAGTEVIRGDHHRESSAKEGVILEYSNAK